MISALYRYPRGPRRQTVAREWAGRSAAARRARSVASGADVDTLDWRSKHDRRGRPVVALYAPGSVVVVRHSVAGRSDQFDVLVDGSLWRTCGLRRLPGWARPAAGKRRCS